MTEVGRGERTLECLRNRLCSIYDFSPVSAFHRIDTEACGNVNAQDIVNYLRDQRNYASLSEVEELVRFFDCDKDGVLNLAEFQQMLLPCEDNYLKDRALNRPSIRLGKGGRLPYDQESSLTAILEAELSLQRNVGYYKRSLSYSHDYSITAAFDAVDVYRQGKITQDSLRCFMRPCYPCESQLVATIRRIDIDGDQVLSLSEFQAFLAPDLPQAPAAKQDQ